MKYLVSIAVTVSALLFMGNSHAQTWPSILDPSDGACDEYYGLNQWACRNAHRTNNIIKRLSAEVEGDDNANLFTLWWLDVAKRRLEAQKAWFETLTGEQVPGLGECPFPSSTFPEEELVENPYLEYRDGGPPLCLVARGYGLSTVWLLDCSENCSDWEGYEGRYWFFGLYLLPDDTLVGYYKSPEDQTQYFNAESTDGQLTKDEYNACLIEYGCQDPGTN